VSILERCDRAAAVALANVSRIHLRRMSPLALFGAIARRHVGPSVDVKSASGFDDLILVYALKVEREYGSIKSFCACFCCVRKFGLGAPFFCAFLCFCDDVVPGLRIFYDSKQKRFSSCTCTC